MQHCINLHILDSSLSSTSHATPLPTKKLSCFFLSSVAKEGGQGGHSMGQKKGGTQWCTVPHCKWPIEESESSPSRRERRRERCHVFFPTESVSSRRERTNGRRTGNSGRSRSDLKLWNHRDTQTNIFTQTNIGRESFGKVFPRKDSSSLATTTSTFRRVLKTVKIHHRSNFSVKIIFFFVDLNYPRITIYLNS